MHCFSPPFRIYFFPLRSAGIIHLLIFLPSAPDIFFSLRSQGLFHSGLKIFLPSGPDYLFNNVKYQSSSFLLTLIQKSKTTSCSNTHKQRQMTRVYKIQSSSDSSMR